jgi:hypothetical protein
LTRVSLGKPLRRFDVGSKAGQVGVIVGRSHDRLLSSNEGPAHLDSRRLFVKTTRRA